MINGIYSSATALNNYSRQQEIISSNLANINTPGFRRGVMAFREFSEQPSLNRQPRGGTEISDVAIDFSTGGRQSTERQLDLSISGDGFFVFQGQDGELYSRNGVLFRAPDGTLINQDGMPILGAGETVKIPNNVSDREIAVSDNGTIYASGREVGTISVVKFDDPQLLEPNGQVYFRTGTAVKEDAPDSQILQGTREMANTQAVTELISMIVGSRNFESAQRAMRTIFESLEQSVRS